MIDDLSRALKTILEQDSLPKPLKEADIVLVRPSDNQPQKTTINLFLYDIRENVELRSHEPIIDRSGGQAVIRRPPLRIACSYLVTAWSVVREEPELAEHLLLSQVVDALARCPTVPPEFLPPNLRNQMPPLPVITLQPEGLKNPAEFWSALGCKLRPAVTVTATISMPVSEDITGPAVTTVRTGYSPDAGLTRETMIQIGGQVWSEKGEGVADAFVEIVDAGLYTKTDNDGYYSFPRVPAGARTIRVVAAGFEPRSQPLEVPGWPEDYRVILTPLK